MSFVAMTQKHCNASVVKAKRSDSSILAHIDDRLQRVISRTRSIVDGSHQEAGKGRRIRSNLGRKRVSIRSLRRCSLPADTGFNIIGDTLRGGEADDNVRITPSIDKNFSDHDHISISDFPTPPASHHQATVEGRPSADNTLINTESIGPILNLEPLVSRNMLDESPALRDIDLMIGSYPSLKLDLSIVRRAILDNEKEITAANERVERQLHQQLVEALLKNDQLQQSVNEKEAFMLGVYERLDQYEDQIEISAAQLREAKVRMKWLEDEVERLDGIARGTQREHEQKIVSHSRDKKLLKDEWEEKLKAEKLKFNEIVRAKELAISFNDSMNQNYAFYRNYFDQQQQLYRTYFGQYGQEKGFTPSEARMGGLLSMPAISEGMRKDGDGGDESMRLATETLRNQYLNNAKSDPSANTDSNQDQPENISKPLRGLEFLALLEPRPYEVSPGVTVLLPSPLSKLTDSTTALRGSVSSSGSESGGSETGEGTITTESGTGISTCSSSSSITAKPTAQAEVLPLRISREENLRVDQRASRNHSAYFRRLTSYRGQSTYADRVDSEIREGDTRRRTQIKDSRRDVRGPFDAGCF